MNDRKIGDRKIGITHLRRVFLLLLLSLSSGTEYSSATVLYST